jgi:hypothetical protein
MHQNTHITQLCWKEEGLFWNIVSWSWKIEDETEVEQFVICFCSCLCLLKLNVLFGERRRVELLVVE